MRELNTLLGIQTKLSMAFYPQTDGQTERANREIETYLQMFINHRQDDWAEWLAICEFSLNNKNQTSSRQSLFYLNYGRHPRMGVEQRKESKVEAVDDFARRMKQTWEEARSALVKAGEEMKKYADRRVGEMPDYRVGDKAFIFTDNLNTTRPSRKLEQKKIGPYEVVGVPTKNTVTLKLPKSLQIHPTISTHHTEKANQPTIPGQQVSPPPPVRVQGEEEFEVETILDSRLRRGRLEYLVRWKGYTPEHDSWEPERNLENTPEQIVAFRSRHSGAPRRVS